MSLSATDLSTTTPCPRMQPPTTRAIRRQVVHGEVRRVASGATTGCSPTANCAVVETGRTVLKLYSKNCVSSLYGSYCTCRVDSVFPPPGPCPVPLFSQHHSKISLPLFYLRNTQLSEEGAVPIRCSQFLPLSKASQHVQRANSAAHHEKCVSTRAQKIHHDQDQRPRARRTRTRTDGKPPTPYDRTGVPTNQADERPN